MTTLIFEWLGRTGPADGVVTVSRASWRRAADGYRVPWTVTMEVHGSAALEADVVEGEAVFVRWAPADVELDRLSEYVLVPTGTNPDRTDGAWPVQQLERVDPDSLEPLPPDAPTPLELIQRTDALVTRIESAEFQGPQGEKGPQGETVGIVGESTATFSNGALTLHPDTAIVHVPALSGAVSVFINDVVLPDGTTNPGGWQSSLLFEGGVAPGTTFTWPDGTVVYGAAPTDGPFAATLARSGGAWSVMFPLLPSGAAPVDISGKLDYDLAFTRGYQLMQTFDYNVNAVRPIPLQEEVTGTLTMPGGASLPYGQTVVDEAGAPQPNQTTIAVALGQYSQVLRDRLNEMAGAPGEWSSGQIAPMGRRGFANPTAPIRPDKQRERDWVDYPHPKIVDNGDGTFSYVHWEPILSTMYSGFLQGQVDPYSWDAPEAQRPTPPDGATATQADWDAYYAADADWQATWYIGVQGWAAYTMPATRDSQHDLPAQLVQQQGSRQ